MENEAAKKHRRFLVEWSFLNLVGWAIGFIFVFMIAYNLESIKHFAWVHGWATDFRKEWIGEAALVWFPLGLCVGIFQWIKLRQFGIGLFTWALITAIGCGILATLCSWALKFDSFEYRLGYDIYFWISRIGFILAMLIGGAIIGALQSVYIGKYIPKSSLWIRAYIFGLLVPSIFGPLTMLAKSFLLELFYSVDFLYILVELRWELFLSFLIIISAISTAVLTGNILLKLGKAESTPIGAG